MMKKGLLLLIPVLLMIGGCASTQKTTIPFKGQQAQTFSAQITVSGQYLLYLPEGYGQKNTRWPLVIFLHGMGERGSDIELVKRHGPPKLVQEGKQFPFILVSPQCPDDSWWSTPVLTALLDKLENELDVDRSRVYVTGLSMGGFGTWSLALANPDRFAAIAPICGGGDTSKVCALKNTPVWVFHGQKDPVVPVAGSEKMVNTLKECGGNVQFTVYPEVGHDSWTETYNNPKLYEWMLSQSRERH